IRRTQRGAGIFLVPALGGPERELLSPIWSGFPSPGGLLSWSSDGKLLAVAGGEAAQSRHHIYLLSLDSFEKRQLTSATDDLYGDLSPAFSPDGQRLAFIRSARDIYVAPVAGGEPTRLTFDNRTVLGLAWSQDGSEIVFSSTRAGSPSLW